MTKKILRKSTRIFTDSSLTPGSSEDSTAYISVLIDSLRCRPIFSTDFTVQVTHTEIFCWKRMLISWRTMTA